MEERASSGSMYVLSVCHLLHYAKMGIPRCKKYNERKNQEERGEMKNKNNDLLLPTPPQQQQQICKAF